MSARAGLNRKPAPGGLRVVEATAGSVPACPAWLTNDAKAEYYRIGESLLACGAINSLDGHALAMVASSYATWVEAEKAVIEHGLLVKGRDGTPAVNPFRKVANEAHDRTRQLLIEFGMTPRSRVKKMQSSAVTSSDDAWDGDWWEVTV